MSKPPEILYHYTSIDAFKGIIDNKHLRMTRYDQMNDTSELSFGLKMFVQYVEDYRCSSEEQDILKKNILQMLSICRDYNLFITSFSEQKNDLSQWRAYTPNGGVTIGFSTKELGRGYFHEHAEKKTLSVSAAKNDLSIKEEIKQLIIDGKNGRHIGENFLKCEYLNESDLEQEENSSEILESMNTRVKIWFEQDNPTKHLSLKDRDFIDIPEKYRKLPAPFKLHVFRLCIRMKHDAYSGEKEWRWVNKNHNDSEFPINLDKKNRLYIKAGIIPKNCIKEVWISPHGDTEGFKRAVEFYKEKHNMNFKIHESKIPYRL